MICQFSTQLSHTMSSVPGDWWKRRWRQEGVNKDVGVLDVTEVKDVVSLYETVSDSGRIVATVG